MLPIILHIPHSSKVIPQYVSDQFIISQAALNRELNLMTDHFTDEILKPLQVPKVNQVISKVSRLVVDMERFADDQLEEMSKVGMGAIYTHGSQKQLIRRKLEATETAYLLKHFYKAHHAALNNVTSRTHQQHNRAIIIDVHSYPSEPLPYESDHKKIRPEICIGTCDFHTPKTLADLLINEFTSAGFDVALNTPFAGVLIPNMFWQKKPDVMGFMLEIRRDVYLNEQTFKKHNHFKSTSQKISNVLIRAINEFNEVLPSG